MEKPRFLVATDLSVNGRPAALTGATVAEMMGGEYAGVHVVDLSLWKNRKIQEIWKDEALAAKVEESARRWFRQAGVEAPSEVIVETGDPERVVREILGEGEWSGLMIAMSGKGAWSKWVFGSMALGLTNPPPCDLYVAHADHPRLQEGSTVAVGVDFSKASEIAVKRAAALARTTGSGLGIVSSHALPTMTYVAEDELPEGMETTTVVHWAKESMERFLEKLSDTLEGLEVRSRVIAEPPVLGLRRYVDEEEVDWLVLGHRSSKERRGSSSVKGKWIQQMTCSTLLVPSEEP